MPSQLEVEISAVLQTIDSRGVEDRLLVASVVQLMDECRRVADLYALGKRLSRESMSDGDRKILSRVFRDCKRALRVERVEYVEPKGRKS